MCRQHSVNPRGRPTDPWGVTPALRATLFLLAVIAWGGPTTSAADELEVYRPRHRLASELAPLVSGVLAPSGLAMADPGSGRLIIRGDRASIKTALDLLRELDAH